MGAPSYRERDDGAGYRDRWRGRSDDSEATQRSTANESSTPRWRPAKRLAPEQSNSQELSLRVGDDVEHPKFGEGVIINIEGLAKRPKPRSASVTSAPSICRWPGRR